MEEAYRHFPEEATSRRNAFELLDRLILTPLEKALAWPHRFEKLTPAEPGSPIRIFQTQHAMIPPVTIYLALVDDVVQLLGFECDFGYYELIRDDPDD